MRARSFVVRFLVCVLTWWGLEAATAHAEPLDDQRVPPELRPWIPWVLDEVGDEACTMVAASHQCVWLGSVSITATASGATFSLQVVTERRTKVPLPGGAKLWPQEVKVGTDAATVLADGPQPYTRLPAGTHTIEGRFSWQKLPEVLPLPAAVARVALVVDDVRVEMPRRTDDGGVWLGGENKKVEDTTETDSLELSVTRRVQDGVPLRVTTQLELRVGGRPREVRLPTPLLVGGELLEMQTGDLSARFEPGGSLVVEARSGNHTITLDARHLGAESLRLEKRAEPWTADEVWAWAPDVALRQAEVSGGSAIDPAQTRLPEAWRSLAAFKLRAPATFAMKTLRRGQTEAPPNKLAMSRLVILDFDGDGYTVVDNLAGTMHRDWRLTFAGKEKLGNLSADEQDKLITVNGAFTAVELRQGRVQVSAVSRGEGAPSQLEAVGWDTDVDRLDVELRLPPGWELLWASGVDDMTSKRLSRWELIDLLLVLGLALAIGKLCGWVWAPVAAVAFALAHDAGHAAWWAWAPLIACVYLLRRFTSGRWHGALRAGRMAAASVLVYALVVFAAAQLQSIAYPQAVAQNVRERQYEDKEVEEVAWAEADNKEGGTGTRAKGEEGSMGRPHNKASNNRYGVAGPGRANAMRSQAALGDADAPSAPPAQGQPSEPELPQAEQDPQAVIQTGPGMPRWEYSEHTLSWIGPVQKGRQIRLWLLSPLWRALLAVFAVTLSAGMFVVLFRVRTDDDGPPKPRAAGALAVFMLMLLPTAARAQTPSTELLADLKGRLTRAPDCAPDCVAVSNLSVSTTDTTLTLTASVHAGARSAYQLPGPASSWVPSSVEVDGAPSRALALIDGHLHLRLPPGQHTVVLRGPIQGSELALALGTAPHRVLIEGAAWDIDGVDDEGHAEASIRLFRAIPGVPTDETEPAPPPAAAEPTTLPPWLEVRRVFDVGVKWTLRTTVRRVSARGKPIVVKFPLLDGENVTEGAAKQQGRNATITIESNSGEVSFISSLTEAPTVTLKAAEARPWTEVWLLSCSEVWRCSHEGIAPVSHMNGGAWRPTFKPWPGEAVTFALQKPTAADGRSLTVTSAKLAVQVQDRISQAKLEVHVHTSMGGAYALKIPTGVRIDTLRVDGTEQPVQGDGGEVKVALAPGRQRVEVEWQQPDGISPVYRAPEITLGDQVVNAVVDLHVHHGRWLVFAGGPGSGPDFQLWGYLLLLIAVALGISRLPDSPLRPWQWVLLALGLSQAPVALAIMVAAWFFLLAHRKNWVLERGAHNGVQALLVGWTIASAIAIAGVVYIGLAERPEMMIVPRLRADAVLSWYVDRTTGNMPRPWVLSTSIWAWRLLMTAWSAWVAVLLYRWAPTAWANFTAGGMWHKKPAPAPTSPANEASAGDMWQKKPDPTQAPPADEAPGDAGTSQG